VSSKYTGSTAVSGTNESMTSAEEDACSSAFNLLRFEAHVLVLRGLVAFDRLFARDNPVDGALETHLDPGAAFRVEERGGAWRRWKATFCELVAVKSWTGITARPRVMSRFFSARGIVS
jgi:hypothetical protein